MTEHETHPRLEYCGGVVSLGLGGSREKQWRLSSSTMGGGSLQGKSKGRFSLDLETQLRSPPRGSEKASCLQEDKGRFGRIGLT